MKDFSWKEFAKKYWERGPTTFATVSKISADDIFKILVQYSDRCRAKKTAGAVKFYVEGQPQFENEVLENLPVRSDESFEGYHRRIQKRFDDYCLVCDGLRQIASPKWKHVKDFVTPLYQEVGIPNRFSEIGFYAGNYRKTPFGVHVDGCGVFSFPVVGKKVFRIWDRKFVEKNPDLKEAHQYDCYTKNSQLIEVSRGEVAYWPSHAWHIAESRGAFSATWSVGVWLNQPLVEFLLEALRELLSKKLGKRSEITALEFQGQTMPREISDLLTFVRKIPQSEWEKHSRSFWARHISRCLA